MRLVWSLKPGDTRCRVCGVDGVAQGLCGRHRHNASSRVAKVAGAMIGPRLRLPQAKDVPEDAIMRVLRAEPLRTFTHWDLDADNSLPRLAPELAAFPAKVLVAKLASMKRRGLVDGRAKADQRGDWHIATPAYWLVRPGSPLLSRELNEAIRCGLKIPVCYGKPRLIR